MTLAGNHMSFDAAAASFSTWAHWLQHEALMVVRRDYGIILLSTELVGTASGAHQQ